MVSVPGEAGGENDTQHRRIIAVFIQCLVLVPYVGVSAPHQAHQEGRPRIWMGETGPDSEPAQGDQK